MAKAYQVWLTEEELETLYSNITYTVEGNDNPSVSSEKKILKALNKASINKPGLNGTIVMAPEITESRFVPKLTKIADKKDK